MVIDAVNQKILIHAGIFVVFFSLASVFITMMMRRYKTSKSSDDNSQLILLRRDDISLADDKRVQREGFAQRLTRDIGSVYAPRYDKEDTDEEEDSSSDEDESDESDDDTTSDDNSDDSNDQADHVKKINWSLDDPSADDVFGTCDTSDSDADSDDDRKAMCHKAKAEYTTAEASVRRRANKVNDAVTSFMEEKRKTITDIKNVARGALTTVQSKINHAINQYAT